MIIDKRIIDEALNFYNIDLQYKDKCYNCVEEINKKEKLNLAFLNLYEKLYIEEFTKIKELWHYKDVDDLFAHNTNSFVTNIMILIGYHYHQENMKKHNFDDVQINIHKKRVKECFEYDLKVRKRDGVRISQMLWAIYFIRTKIIEIGSLQFECDSDSVVKIHIPKNTDLNIFSVKESIKKATIEMKQIYSMNSFKYICNSWLLSKQIYEIVDKNSNISKFYELFDVTEGEECINDILNFVYGMDQCEDYFLLPTNTTLQSNIKNELLNDRNFYLGLGILKENAL